MKVGIQGYEGSFHEEACEKYYGKKAIPASCDTFDLLAKRLKEGQIDKAVMAIENSIAGSILQNYRLLREIDATIEGEIYLHIRHQLMVNQGTQVEDIKKVYSHPMAINQCLPYLHSIGDLKLIETADTALSAKYLADNPHPKHAVIASQRAAEIYGLKIVGANIETHRNNYTRFYMLSMLKSEVISADKASVYLSIPDEKGKLLQVLSIIDNFGINMSVLQSFPVVGTFRAYFFHIDLEFDNIENYLRAKDTLKKSGFNIEELGLYKRADKQIIHQINS